VGAAHAERRELPEETLRMRREHAEDAVEPRKTQRPSESPIAGDVPNYVSVTDDMLKNPDPGDWLMIRHDYHATNSSPLKEITPANVKDLQLVYMHPMREGGTNQPAPIAHNGIIYLANTQGILQAINGVTGKIIWETKVQGTIAPRGIAIYQDKILFANGNNVSAVDARNGKAVWSTNIGHSNSSGPIVAKGKVIEGMGGCAQVQRGQQVLSERLRRGDRKGSLEVLHHGNERRGRRQHLGNLPDKMRVGSEMWITGSYDPVPESDVLGNSAGQAVDDPDAGYGR
jgi:alcohol dehydrogenase (cytochrome c)